VLQALRRPASARPIEEEIALWQAGEDRERAMQDAAAQDNLEEVDAVATRRLLQRELRTLKRRFRQK
jgi:hypothetical protein